MLTHTNHKPGDLLSRATEVFVAPRVIDESAYTRFAADLRETLERVASETTALSESTANARSFIDDVNAKKAQRRNEIESVTKLLKAADARAQRIDETVRAAQAQLGALQNIEQTAQQIADRKSREIEARINKVLADFEAKLETKAAEREQKFMWAAHEAEEAVLERIIELREQNDRAQSILGRPPASHTDAPVSHNSLLDVLQRTDEGNERLSNLRQRIAECDFKARDSVEALDAALDESLARSEELRQTHAELADAAENGIRITRSVEKTLTSRSDELADLSASLGSLVERASGSTSTLKDVMQSCEALHKHSQARYDELTALTETITGLTRHLEHWRPYLEPEECEDGLPPLPPVLRRIVDDFRSGLAMDIARLADAVNSVVDRNATPLGRSRG